ncbi:hypothetical protein NM688_g6048 [Phlebia brevispora]|uniref:Uncharacterized protein n=1 Tax=Phlebia brevispora TaxID=194682 RepID=A0ACC1SKH3_9APHY|nr:hypothetical protein NM688_g6048 [Phlebia brevispora]
MASRSRVFVVLGGGDLAGVYDKDHVPLGRFLYKNPFLPIVVKCCTAEEATRLHETCGSIFKDAEDMALTDKQLTARIFFSERLERFYADASPRVTEFFPVLSSRVTWSCVYLDRVYVESITHGYRYAKYASCRTFPEALAWMVLKGGGKRVKGATFRPFADTFTSQQLKDHFEEISRKMRAMSLEPSGGAASASHRTTTPRTRGNPSRHTPHSGQIVEVESDSDSGAEGPEPVSAPRPFTCSTSVSGFSAAICEDDGISNLVVGLRSLDDLDVNDYHRRTGPRGNPHAEPPNDTRIDDDAMVFVSVRRLDGTISRNILWRDEERTRQCIEVPSLGKVVDDVLQVFGFDSSSVVFIHHLYQSTKDVRHFVRTLAAQGMPILLAVWLWDYIVLPGATRRHTDFNLALTRNMVAQVGAREAFALHAHKTRKIRTTQARISWRNRYKKKISNPLTAEQIKARIKKLAERRDEKSVVIKESINEIKRLARALWERFRDHTPQYYFRLITQQAHRVLKKRKTSQWNAYVHQESKRRISEGLDPAQAHLLVPELRATWATMSKEEKHEKTKDAVAELDQIKENKEYAPHNVNISGFHDARANLDSIEDQLSTLAARTGTECILIAVRDNMDSWLLPRSWVSSERMGNWFAHTTGMSLARFAGLTESFAVSGLEGTRLNREQELNDMKRECSDLILEKLTTCAAPEKITRMNYANFSLKITEKHGIICVGWPLDRFVCPSEIKTKLELGVLLNSWKNGSTYFKKLSPEELRAQPPPSIPSETAIPTPSTPSANQTAPIASTSSLSLSSVPDQLQQAPLLPPPPPFPEGAPSSVQGVLLSNGQTLVAQKTRKKRSDAGKPRGPRKKAATSDGTMPRSNVRPPQAA